MSGRRIKTSKVDREDYHKYWKKAEEFYETAEDRLTKGKWNAAALNAIHSGISANDALLVCFHGVKSMFQEVLLLGVCVRSPHIEDYICE